MQRYYNKLIIIIAAVTIVLKQISLETGQWLRDHQDTIQSVEIGMHIQEREIVVSNVAGFIPGSQAPDHRHAIVLSAHFDHVGWSGKANEKTIYRGSVDNASGVSALLQLASMLSEAKAMQSNVIFAAFNGEESGMLGSKAFVKQLEDDYDHVYNINLDCLGIADGGRLLLVSNEANSLVTGLQDYFMKLGIDSTTDGSYGDSDHLSFAAAGFPAVTLSQENISVIHTVHDVPDVLDYDLLDQYVGALSAFIQEVGDSPELVHGAPSSQVAQMTPQEQAVMSKLIEEAQEEQQQLHLGEYKLIGSEEKHIVVTGLFESFVKAREAEQAVKGLKLPQSILNYQFSSVTINADLPENELTENSDMQINTVYQADITINEVNSVALTYKEQNGEGVSVQISKAPIEFEDPNMVITTEKYEGHEYDVVDTGKFIVLMTEATVKDETYYLQIYGGRDHVYKGDEGEEQAFVFNWASKNKQQALKWVHSVPWSQLIEEIGI